MKATCISFYDSIAGRFDKMFYSNDSDPYFRFNNTRMRVVLEGALHQNFAVLDAGCGTGVWASFIERLVRKIVCLDISSKMLIETKKRGITNMARGDVDSLPFKGNTFDAVICLHGVLGHNISAEKAFCEFYRVIRDGGVLIATVGNKARLKKSLWSLATCICLKRNKRLDYSLSLNGAWIPVSTMLYSAKEVGLSARNTGFTQINVTSFSTLPLLVPKFIRKRLHDTAAIRYHKLLLAERICVRLLGTALAGHLLIIAKK